MLVCVSSKIPTYGDVCSIHSPGSEKALARMDFQSFSCNQMAKAWVPGIYWFYNYTNNNETDEQNNLKINPYFILILKSSTELLSVNNKIIKYVHICYPVECNKIEEFSRNLCGHCIEGWPLFFSYCLTFVRRKFTLANITSIITSNQRFLLSIPILLPSVISQLAFFLDSEWFDFQIVEFFPA